MSPFRPFVDLFTQLWLAIDTANALRHGNPVSERARVYCMAESTRTVAAPGAAVPA